MLTGNKLEDRRGTLTSFPREILKRWEGWGEVLVTLPGHKVGTAGSPRAHQETSFKEERTQCTSFPLRVCLSVNSVLMQVLEPLFNEENDSWVLTHISRICGELEVLQLLGDDVSHRSWWWPLRRYTQSKPPRQRPWSRCTSWNPEHTGFLFPWTEQGAY